MKKSLLVLVLFLGVSGAPTIAQAGDIWHYMGQNAGASFSAADPSNPDCVVVNAWVSANSGKWQSPPGPGSSGTDANIGINRYDSCAGTYLLDAWGWSTIPDQDFTITGASAKLNTTISVYDWVSNSSFPVTIDVTWTPTGPPTRQSYHEHYHSAHYNSNFRWTGTYRPADATGTVSDGTTNFTPETTMWANFGTGRTMQVAEY